ncbi:hypothetical protein CH380_10590 [Leptospira adleri]|uniref:Uncharacterized protein n=1 Tax=Leptospira adleri TaxID=2023186 RepID=A0A2M9YP17_9LEPT|nr:hypothetical protein CH380_10590 [Leptospira adleri]PJZ63943.1 hypothetical protein CH376_00520 [Leptospira adleri]
MDFREVQRFNFLLLFLTALLSSNRGCESSYVLRFWLSFLNEKPSSENDSEPRTRGICGNSCVFWGEL